MNLLKSACIKSNKNNNNRYCYNVLKLIEFFLDNFNWPTLDLSNLNEHFWRDALIEDDSWKNVKLFFSFKKKSEHFYK